MIKIEKIFFCDHVEESQFNKFNFIGTLLTNEIQVSPLPYHFISNLVVIGETNEDIFMKVEVWNESELLHILYYNKQLNTVQKLTLLEYFKIVIVLTKFEKYFFKVYNSHDNSILFNYEIMFSEGKSQNLNINKHLPFSGILNNEVDLFLIKDILRIAKFSIMIIDSYLSDIGSLQNLLDGISSKVEVTLLTDSKNKSKIERHPVGDKTITLKYMTPLQSKKFHDRFIIIDNSEYYHFGSSINGINPSKVSSFRKIVSLAEIAEFQDKFAEIIKQS